MSTKQLLLFPILIVFALIPAFADDENLIIQTDKGQYHTGDELTVSGVVQEKKMPVVAMRMYDPDGTIISANNVEIDEFNTFSRTIRLDSPFFDKPGIYLIKFDYGRIQADTTFEMLSGLPLEEPEIDTEKIIPEVLILNTDKSTYKDGDFIAISGAVSALAEPSVLVGIYDPFGTPTGFYFGDIGPDLRFSVSFLAKDGVNFKTQGLYTVKAHYGESKREISFGFNDVTESHEILPPDSTPEKKPETKSVSKTVITSSQNFNPQTTETKKPDEPKTYEKEPVVQDNLTVKDVELGKMLNQMALNCYSSDYVDSISYYDGMGPALMRLCKYDSAITFFDRSLEENPENIGVLTNKGSALVRLGQYNEAITYYDLALKIQPDYLPAINNKANALAELGNFKEAISLYNSVLDHEPTYVVAKINLEKARERLLLTKNQEQMSTDQDSTIKVSDETPKTENKINHKEEKPVSILEQIGSVFSFLSANVFGLMK